VIGVVAGVAAQRSLGNLLAGFQIALTQPILLEDYVNIEGEAGYVEEITLSYVVVRLWELSYLLATS
jgi:small-conductance mechanosensitive channel